jgi:small ligand-binding sensory domain FIST
VRHLLQPRVLVGCTTSTVIAGTREVEDGGGLALWCAHGVDASANRLPGPVPAGAAALIVLGDPYSFAVDDLLAATTVPVVGGLASAARGAGGNRLVLDGRVFTDGAVVVALGRPVDAVVSQGCRPVGDALIVTRAEGSLVHELGGRPALERVQDVLATLTPAEVEAARRGLLVGRVVDESKPTFASGDFLIRTVLGGDRSNGAIAIDDEIEVGATLQLQVRDASTADTDLRTLLDGRGADGALAFTCNGRGASLFGAADHEATLIADAVGGAVAGMWCAGEIGPVGGRSFLHAFTASVALFRD